jgi:hypothetical protein
MARSPVGRFLLAPLLLMVAALTTFGPVAGNNFVHYDDQQEIVTNPDLNPPSFEKLNWNWTHTRLSLYMPMTYYVWGAIAAVAPPKPGQPLDPTLFHVVNLGLHTLCAVLVYWLILRLWNQAVPALAGAMVFAVHPLQTEAVAWASGMYTLLSCALGLGVMVIHVHLESPRRGRGNPPQRGGLSEEPARPAISRRLILLVQPICIFLYLLALLTKPSAICLPIMIAVVDLLILQKPLRRTAIRAAVGILIGLPIVYIARRFQDVSSLPPCPIWTRPLIALDAIGFYLRKLVLPTHLLPDYGRTPGWALAHPPQLVMSVIVGSCLLLAGWLARRRVMWVSAAVGLFIAGILPYLGLAQFDFQHISTVADRYAYLGMVGVAVFCAGLAGRSRFAAAGLLVICCIWAPLSHAQAMRWRDDESLFGYTLKLNPRSLLAHSAMGYLAANRNPRDEAAAEANYKAALRVWPQDAEVLFNLGNLYLRHNPAAAVEQYQRAIANQPKMPEYHNNLAVALAKLGQFQLALDQWQQAITLAPGYMDARNNRGDMYGRMNQPQAAIRDYKEVLRIDPNNPHAIAMLNQMGQLR